MQASLRRATAVLLTGLMVLIGCGPADPIPYDVSGTITVAGKNIPRGMIYFEPDASKQVKGMMGFAEIVDSKYDTKLKGRGVLPGYHFVRVNGYDGKASPESPYGAAIFPEYRQPSAREFPATPSTLDIDVAKPVK
jgi:hypothetical protein